MLRQNNFKQKENISLVKKRNKRRNVSRINHLSSKTNKLVRLDQQPDHQSLAPVRAQEQKRAQKMWKSEILMKFSDDIGRFKNLILAIALGDLSPS